MDKVEIYRGIVQRLEADTYSLRDDGPHIMWLLGYEAAPHRRMGMACRRFGQSNWQSMPSIRSADDAALWCRDAGGLFEDMNQSDDCSWTAGYSHSEYGIDYGKGPSLGLAMWSAFVKLVARVTDEEN